ncbi:MAG: sigma-70 family RNA polymerase sigma factor [Chloroflexi bacterium]|nr:MAG: sigma-70 family RNA polymerase sigma factor [Chloroflexota bacterium]
MDQGDWLAERFEEHRARLRAVAYRMLGSLSEADDAVQDAWLRLARADSGAIDDIGAWLTTVVARVCLDALRSKRRSPEVVRVPDPVVHVEGSTDPAQAALLADAVGLALLVMMETLAPEERVALVLHDVFGVRFDEIAPLMDRTPAATRQLVSRARRRVRAAPVPDTEPAGQRRVVDAFFKAVTDGDMEALLAVLDPDVVVRADFGASAHARMPREVRGARAVAATSLWFARFAAFGRRVLVNGAVGVIATETQWRSVMGFIVRRGRIAEIDILADPERLEGLDLTGVDSQLRSPASGSDPS